MSSDKVPSVFAYNDFRLYLRDYYGRRRQVDASFTKSLICRTLGLPNTRSYFQDILNGKFLSDIKVPLFIKLLDLTPAEGRYFRVLVNFNQSYDPEERELLFDQLISLNSTPKSIVQPQAYAYYKEWRHSAVRAVLNVVDVKDDYAALARSLAPPITLREARQSVELLTELGLIAPDKRGFLKPTQKVISTGAFAQDEVVRQFQLKSIEHSIRALSTNKKLAQRVITKTISVSEEGYRRIEARLEKFNAEITSIVHKDEKQADRVYMMHLTLFPVSRKG